MYMNTNIKKTIFGALSVGMLLASAVGPVFADDTTPAPSASPRPGQVLRQEMHQEIKTMRGDIRSDRAKIHSDRLKNHFAFYATRLTNIDTRIQSLIDKKKAAGKNTDTAQTQLNTSKNTLAQAIADGNKAVDMFNTIPANTWDTQKPEVKAAITQAQLARKEFADARSQAVQAVKLLQNL